MISNKCILLYIACLYLSFNALVNAYPLLEEQEPEQYYAAYIFDDENLINDAEGDLLVRHARSPFPRGEPPQEGGRGRIELKYEDTPQRGREASLQYNHHIIKSNDGSYGLDAYAQGQRNIDANRNDFSGGLQGYYHFKG